MFNRLFEQCYMLRHLSEMSMLGTLEGPKNKKLCIFTFTREYEFEVPHINLGPNGHTAWMKIEIPPELPSLTSDFEIIDFDKRHLVPNSKLKKYVLDWYNQIEEGETNWKTALRLWNTATKVHKDMRR